MTIKKKITIGILTIVCGAMLLLSFAVFMQANSGVLRPDIEELIGKTTEQVNDFSPGFLQLVFFTFKIMAALIFSLSIGLFILLYGPFKRNLKWSTVSIFTPLIIWLISATIIYSRQPSAPWQMWFALLILVIVAFILTLTDKNKST